MDRERSGEVGGGVLSGGWGNRLGEWRGGGGGGRLGGALISVTQIKGKNQVLLYKGESN